jgi:hypothetical protein
VARTIADLAGTKRDFSVEGTLDVSGDVVVSGNLDALGSTLTFGGNPDTIIYSTLPIGVGGGGNGIEVLVQDTVDVGVFVEQHAIEATVDSARYRVQVYTAGAAGTFNLLATATDAMLSWDGGVSFSGGVMGLGDAVIDATGLTASRAIEFQDADGTLALLSDIGAAERIERDIADTSHGFSVGMPVYKPTSSGWAQADRDAAVSAAEGIVAAVADANNFTLVTHGPVTLTTGQWDARTGDSGGLTEGEHYWTSSTAGGLTKTEPTTGLKQHVGKAESTTVLMVDIGEVFDLDGAAGGAAVDTIPVTFNGMLGVIEVGAYARWRAPAAGTITKSTLLADVSGSIVVDVYKDTYANYPPMNADSITASAPPTISSATKAEDATLTGWTTSFAAGDVLIFQVESCSTITHATLLLDVEYSG